MNDKNTDLTPNFEEVEGRVMFDEDTIDLRPDSEQKQMTVDTTNIPVEVQINHEMPQTRDDLSIDSLNSNERQLVQKIIDSTTLENSESVLNYGVGVQMKVAEFADSILSSVKSKDVDDEVADILADLAVEIRTFGTIDETKKGFISNFLGGINKGVRKVGDTTSNVSNQIKNEVAISKKETEKMKIKYENISKTIDSIEKSLEVAKLQLVKNVTIMDQMYFKNLDYYKELSLYIIAAKEKLKEYQIDIDQQKQIVATTNDQMEIQKLNEMVDIHDKFEKKIDDLTRSRLISIQNAPQIRLVQRGSEQLIYQIQNSIFTAIPVWKSQMVISLGISSNKTALGLQKHISETTNELLIKNSELLKQGALEIAEEGEKGLVTIDTLKTTNENLIDTIEGVLEVQKRGKQDRVAAEKEIAKLELELKSALKGDGKTRRTTAEGNDTDILKIDEK